MNLGIIRVKAERSFTIFPFIFIAKWLMGIDLVGRIAHESVHRLRQMLWFLVGVTLGWFATESFLWALVGGLAGEFLWFVCYFCGRWLSPLRRFSSWFRWLEEKPAWRAQIFEEMRRGRVFNASRIKAYSYILENRYWGMVSYAEAYKFVVLTVLTFSKRR